MKSSKALFEFLVSSISLPEKSEAEAMSYILLKEFYELSKLDIILNKSIAPVNLIDLESIVARLNAHEPLQYILGSTEFYKRKFKVNRHVLIPRPETEELVELIIRDHQHKPPLRIMDACTGSGCIAISLAAELATSKVCAFDISKSALEIAKWNAAANHVSVDFFERDAMLPWKGAEPTYDIIVSNPPYVRESESVEMNKNVLDYEPALALFVKDADPLVFYRSIAKMSALLLKHGGRCYFEINEKMGSGMIELLAEEGFTDICIKKDLFGKDRFATGLRSHVL